MPTRLKHRPVRIVLPPGAPVAAALVIHSWWGLTASFTDYAEQLASNGVAVGLSDLFDGRTAATPAGARALRQAPRAEPIYRGLQRDITGLLDAARLSQVAVIGFSMGAHWAVWLSQQAGNPIQRVVLYYGARGGDFAGSRADYLAHFADNDAWVSATARHGMERALARAGRPYRAYDYAGTGHWFAESAAGGSYDGSAASSACHRSLAFLGAA